METLQPPGRLVVIHSPKGGSGKSALATNLAGTLASRTGRPIVLVDLALADGDLEVLLDVEAAGSWADLARWGHFGFEELEQVLATAATGVRLLAAPGRSGDATFQVVPALVRHTLGLLRQRFSFVVVDTPPVLDAPTLAAVALADRLLVPLPLTVSALRRVQRSLQHWHDLAIDTSRLLFVPWNQRGEISPESARKLLGPYASHAIAYDPRGVELAINVGQCLAALAPASPYARSLRSLAAEVAGTGGSGFRRNGFWDWLGGKRGEPDVVS